MFRNRALFAISLLLIAVIAFGAYFVQYNLNGFLLWRGITTKQVVLQHPIDHTEGSAVLYRKPEKAGLVLVGKSGKRYVELKHEKSDLSSQAMLLTAPYLTILPGGEPKASLVVGGYGFVQDRQSLELQSGKELVKPELQMRDGDKGLIYYIHILNDIENSESYTVVIH